MKKRTLKAMTDPDARIVELVRTLREAEAELQALTGGQLDAVMSEGSEAYLLREAQEKLRGSEAAQRAMAETQTGILNALPAHIALLDSQGMIVAVNEAWRRFATASVPQRSDFFVGHNYLGVCDSAHGGNADEAQAVATGIRKVLSGEKKDFSIEYPCHSPTEKRWFRLMVTPLSETPGAGVVVMHINVTERRLAEEILREKEQEQRRLAEELTIETRRLHESQAVANVGSWETELATLGAKWTEETFRIFETSPDEFVPTHQGFLERVHPEDRERVDEAFQRSIGQPGQFSIEHRLSFPDGRIKFVEERWQAIKDAAGRPVRAIGTCQDITRRKAAEEQIQSRARQQEAIAQVGFEATRATTLEGIFDFVTRTVAGGLGVELCKVLQLAPDGSHLRLVSGVGWQHGLIGVGTVGVDRESQAGFTLISDGPIYVNDFARETRFKAPPLLRQHDVVSGLSVKILLRDKPWGVLGAHCRTVRNFNDADADFMQAVATLVAVVIERLAVQRTLTQSEARMRDAQRIAHLGNWERDLAKDQLTWSEEVFRIFGVDSADFSGTYEAFLAFVHPDDREAMKAAQRAVLSGQAPFEIEHRIIRGDGEVRFVRERGELIHDEGGVPIALSGTVLDITDLRAAHSRAERMNALLTEAQRIADMGSWEMDLATGELFWSEETCRLFGIRPEEFGGTFDAFTDFIVPEDRTAYGEVHARITPAAPLLEVEYRIRRPDGVVRWMFERGRVSFDAAGSMIRRIGVVMDITVRKQTEAERNRMFNLSLDMLCVATFEGRFEQVNPAWTECLGWTAEELTTRPMNEFILPEDHEATSRTRVRIQQGEQVRGFENRYRCKDGSYRWLSWNVHPLLEARQVFAVARDVTERRKYEEQLRLLETCVSRLNDIVLITEAEPIDEPGPRILYCNDAFVRRTGFTREEAIGKTPRLLQGPKTQRDVLDRIRSKLKAWKPCREELINYTKSGEEFWLELEIVPVADATGWFTHWVAIERDITERKLAEAALAESQRKYRDLVETSHDLIWSTSAEGLITFMNLASRHIFGREPEEMVGKHFAEFISPEQLERDLEAFTAAMETGREEMGYVTRAYRKDGSLAILSANIRILKDANGRVTGCTCNARDITESMRAQEALTQSEARFRGLFDQAAVGMCIKTTEGSFLRTNGRFCKIVGYSAEELLQRNWIAITHPDDREREAEIVARMLAGRLQTAAWEKRYLHKDGHPVWCNLALSLLPEGDGQSGQLAGVIEDITERRSAIEQLWHREQLLRIAGKVARMGGWSVDFPEVRINWSDEVCAIHDVPAGTVPTLDLAIGFYTPEWRPIIKSAFSDCAQKGTPFDVELEMLTAKGRRIWVRAIGQAERDKAGAIQRVQGAFQDITEQKKAEADTLRAAETLAGIVQVQQEISKENMPLPAVMQMMAERARALTGATGGAVEFAEGSEMVYAAVAGVVADKIGLRLKREGSLSGLAFTTGQVLYCVDTETDPRVELPLCRKVGARSMVVAPLRVGEEIIGVLKVLSDEPHAFAKRDVHNLQILVETLGVVIQRQRAAEALLTSMEEFRNLAEAMPQIVWVTRPDGWTTYFNQHWMDYTGLALDESLGHGWTKPFHPEDQQRAWEAWQRATSTVGEYALECRLRRADGEYRWWLIRGEPQKDAEGNVLKWFGTCTDIDDLKNAELQVTRANRALKMLSACNEAIIHVELEEWLLQKVCEIAIEVGGYCMAWVGYAQGDAIRPMTWAGAEEGYLKEIQLSLRDDDISGRGPAARAILENEIVECKDMEADPSFHWLEAARRRGYRGVICLPLSSSGRAFGVLALYSSQVTGTPAEEHRLLRDLADDLAFGIQTLRSRIENRKMQQAVIAIASGVSSCVGDAFFSSLLRHTLKALHADAGFLAVLESPESLNARTITAIIHNEEIDNFHYSLKGTPCEQVVLGQTCLVEQNVQVQYPEDEILIAHRIEAYAATPLRNSQGAVIGLISVLFQKPIIGEQFIPSTLQIFAARAASELERLKSDQQLREQAALLNAAHDAILVKDLEDRVLYWNKGAERLYGWLSNEAIGRKARNFLYGDSTEVEQAFQKVLKNGRWEGELHNFDKEGKTILVQASWTLLFGADGRPTSVLAINSDLTEKKKLEAQFLRAQRMESIGTLAGGIAHDLNNVLAPIMMSVDLLKLTSTNEETKNLLATLLSSAQRGANLVSQLLSFARGMEGQRIPVNVGHLVRELVRVIRETFPKNILVEFHPSAALWTVIGDPTQIHQVILNLCVNARDAMPNGGKLLISAENIVLDDTFASMNLNARAGTYVVIKTEDSGTGIPPELMERIFEPFFTTKTIGRGTGLGLSTTMAIVKSHSGFINLYSEVGKGTKFKVYFPADASREASEERTIVQTRLPRGKGELILVVDDEESVRNVARTTLERFGYSVMVAAHGAEAIAIYAQNQDAVAIILTDMAMPIMDGPTLIIALKSINPKVRIIGSSGLSSNGGTARAVGTGVKHFIPKPYTAEAMLTSIRAILDSD